MKRAIAVGCALGTMVALAGCGLGAAAPGAGTVSSTASARGGSTSGGPCRSAYFPALRAAAEAKLPVRTTEAAMTHLHAVGATTLGDALGVALTGGALPKAFADTSATGDPLTARPRAGSATWTFVAIGETVNLTVRVPSLGGGALEAAKALGPAWAGGTAQYDLSFPAGALHGATAPALSDYLRQLAAAVAGGKADLTVTTGGSPSPRPSQYQGNGGPVALGSLTASGSSAALCAAWHARTVLAYQHGSVTPVDAEMDAVGNGGFVGFASGQFIVESVHAGVDAYTWYALPGLPLPKG